MQGKLVPATVQNMLVMLCVSSTHILYLIIFTFVTDQPFLEGGC